MRFSLIWLLAGVAYLAFATAALARPRLIYVDGLRIMAFLAVVYALNLAAFGRDSRRVLGIGFAIGSVLFWACNYLKSSALPTERVVAAIWTEQAKLADDEALNQRTLDPGAAGVETSAELLARIRASNAVGTVLAGLCGSVLAVVASQRKP
jgi:hypothetical protein